MLPDRPQLLYDVSTDTVALTRVNSAISERAHIGGQELKPVKSRGVASDGLALQIGTYRRGVIQEAAKKKDMVTQSMLSKRNISPQEFGGFVSSHSFGVGRKTRGVQNQMWKTKQQVLSGIEDVGLRRKTDAHHRRQETPWPNVLQQGLVNTHREHLTRNQG